MDLQFLMMQKRLWPFQFQVAVIIHRKQTDELIEWVKRPQIGMSGLAFIKFNADGTLKSSFDKFFNEEQLKQFAAFCNSKPGDLILILAGKEERTRKAISDLRLYMAERLGFASLKNLNFCGLPIFHCLNMMKKATAG